MRFGWMAVFETKGVPSPAVKLISRRLNNRTPHIGFQYKALDESNRVFKHGSVRLGAERKIRLDACPTRFCLLQAQIPHGCIVQSRTPHCFVASTEYPLRTTGKFVGTFCFYVPKNCGRFAVAGECGPNRILPLVIHDPEGRVVGAKARRDRGWQYKHVDVPAELRERVWALAIRINADLRLKLEGDLPPLVALRREWARAIGRRMAAFAPGARAEPGDAHFAWRTVPRFLLGIVCFGVDRLLHRRA